MRVWLSFGVRNWYYYLSIQNMLVAYNVTKEGLSPCCDETYYINIDS
jgi:hypothetical protein